MGNNKLRWHTGVCDLERRRILRFVQEFGAARATRRASARSQDGSLRRELGQPRTIRARGSSVCQRPDGEPSAVRHDRNGSDTCSAWRSPRPGPPWQRAARRGSRTDCLESALAEHALSALDPGAQPLLEILVLLALGDVRGDRDADDLRHGLVVDCRHGLEFVGLVGGQPDCHSLGRFHYSIMPCRLRDA